MGASFLINWLSMFVIILGIHLSYRRSLSADHNFVLLLKKQNPKTSIIWNASIRSNTKWPKLGYFLDAMALNLHFKKHKRSRDNWFQRLIVFWQITKCLSRCSNSLNNPSHTTCRKVKSIVHLLLNSFFSNSCKIDSSITRLLLLTQIKLFSKSQTEA